MTIRFSKTKEEYGEFSNYSKYGFDLDGKRWKTVEHYYQAMKFDDPDIQNSIRKCTNPKDASKIGRSRSNIIKENWIDIRTDYMYNALYEKFTQNTYLHKFLLDTLDEQIIEHSEKDMFWGQDENGKGENILGEMLMDIREVLRDEDYSNNDITDWL